MMVPESSGVTLLSAEVRTLVRLAARIAGSGEEGLRAAMAEAFTGVKPEWVEEVILQSYLFAGFPRALNAMREWRKVSGRAAPTDDEGADFTWHDEWAARGHETCATVYGRFYEPLRRNIRELHPALDAWMIIEGYGKVLSRPALSLHLRELCVVAACAAARQDRQLHSHLHGALHCGASVAELRDVLNFLADCVDAEDLSRYHHLLGRVAGADVR